MSGDETLNTEEAIWLEKARNGNKEAFGKIIEAYQTPVYNLAYRMLNNSGEAEEAAQEAFIRAYTRLESYNPDHKFSTWLLSITSNGRCYFLLMSHLLLIRL
jgi:RNA polymerase sigma-70 factor (ECF subfamily)